MLYNWGELLDTEIDRYNTWFKLELSKLSRNIIMVGVGNRLYDSLEFNRGLHGSHVIHIESYRHNSIEVRQCTIGDNFTGGIIITAKIDNITFTTRLHPHFTRHQFIKRIEYLCKKLDVIKSIRSYIPILKSQLSTLTEEQKTELNCKMIESGHNTIFDYMRLDDFEYATNQIFNMLNLRKDK